MSDSGALQMQLLCASALSGAPSLAPTPGKCTPVLTPAPWHCCWLHIERLSAPAMQAHQPLSEHLAVLHALGPLAGVSLGNGPCGRHRGLPAAVH